MVQNLLKVCLFSRFERSLVYCSKVDFLVQVFAGEFTSIFLERAVVVVSIGGVSGIIEGPGVFDARVGGNKGWELEGGYEQQSMEKAHDGDVKFR